MADMNKIKNHPGFMPFGHSNTKIDKSNTQSGRENERTIKQEKSDAQKSK